MEKTYKVTKMELVQKENDTRISKSTTKYSVVGEGLSWQEAKKMKGNNPYLSISLESQK